VPGVAAIILAAGGSARMGRPKQLLTAGGRTLIRVAAEAAVGAGCRPVVVVLGRGAAAMVAELADLPVTSTVNDEWERGIGTSIRHGVARVIEAAPTADAVAILLADQPLVDAAAVRRLLREFDRSGRPACVSGFAGTVGPPVVVGRPLFPRLLALPDDRGAKAIWADDRGGGAVCPCDAAAHDIDTPDDYVRLNDVMATARNPA
jgi:molybdenum cofactor cytidylyltransferase